MSEDRLDRIEAILAELRAGQSRLEEKLDVLHKDVLDRIAAMEPSAERKLQIRRESDALRERLERYEAENNAHRLLQMPLDDHERRLRWTR